MMQNIEGNSAAAHPKPEFEKRNFTLLELLIVVAIIAILAGILLPVLNSAMERGRSTQCKSNLKTLGLVHFEYASTFDEYVMPVKWDTFKYKDRPTGNGSRWNGYIMYFMDIPMKTVYCPTMKITCSAKIATQQRNFELLGPDAGSWESFGYGKNKLAGQFAPVGKLSQTVHPSSSILLGESDGEGNSMAIMITPQPDNPNNQLYPYHNGSTNLLWVDGHVSTVIGANKDIIYGKLGGYLSYSEYMNPPLNSVWKIFRR